MTLKLDQNCAIIIPDERNKVWSAPRIPFLSIVVVEHG